MFAYVYVDRNDTNGNGNNTRPNLPPRLFPLPRLNPNENSGGDAVNRGANPQPRPPAFLERIFEIFDRFDLPPMDLGEGNINDNLSYTFHTIPIPQEPIEQPNPENNNNSQEGSPENENPSNNIN